MGRILVVDDEPGFRGFVAEALGLCGHEISEASDGEAALEAARRAHFHLVVTDLSMPKLDGFGLIERLRVEQPEVELIAVTAHGTVESAVRAMKMGAFDFLTKPLSGPGELRHMVDRALERHQLRAEKETRTEVLPPLSYGDPGMEDVRALLEKVSRTDASVLLLGESGTGKEVAARTLHAMSPRREGPFSAINCAALSPALLESELFGHEKGAFTGAEERRRGRLELCEGGTFFLDEIGELDVELQAKLLRVIQSRQFERVGGHQTISADLRWVAATHRDLSAMVAQGQFREDLFHRLAVFPIRLPPLRDRQSEIPKLAEALLERIGQELGRPGVRLSEAAQVWLKEQPWPGNVRSLGNCLERAVILADEVILEPADLQRLGPGLASEAAAQRTQPPQDLRLESVERLAIERAMASTGGQRKAAAEALGIGVRTLYDKLKRYGIEP